MAGRGYISHCGGKQRQLASLCLLKILKQIVQDGKSIQACSSPPYNALCADKGLLGHIKQMRLSQVWATNNRTPTEATAAKQ